MGLGRATRPARALGLGQGRAPARRIAVPLRTLAGVACCESEDQPHLIDGLHRVAAALGGLSRDWRFDRMATLVTPGTGKVSGPARRAAAPGRGLGPQGRRDRLPHLRHHRRGPGRPLPPGRHRRTLGHHHALLRRPHLPRHRRAGLPRATRRRRLSPVPGHHPALHQDLDHHHQQPPDHLLGSILGDTTVAAALLDRLLHRSVVLDIGGNSYRLRDHQARPTIGARRAGYACGGTLSVESRLAVLPASAINVAAAARPSAIALTAFSGNQTGSYTAGTGPTAGRST